MEIGTMGLMKLKERLTEQGLAETRKVYLIMGVDLFDAGAGTATADMLDAHCAPLAELGTTKDWAEKAAGLGISILERLAQLMWIAKSKGE